MDSSIIFVILYKKSSLRSWPHAKYTWAVISYLYSVQTPLMTIEIYVYINLLSRRFDAT